MTSPFSYFYSCQVQVHTHGTHEKRKVKWTKVGAIVSHTPQTTGHTPIPSHLHTRHLYPLFSHTSASPSLSFLSFLIQLVRLCENRHTKPISGEDFMPSITDSSGKWAPLIKAYYQPPSTWLPKPLLQDLGTWSEINGSPGPTTRLSKRNHFINKSRFWFLKPSDGGSDGTHSTQVQHRYGRPVIHDTVVGPDLWSDHPLGPTKASRPNWVCSPHSRPLWWSADGGPNRAHLALVHHIVDHPWVLYQVHGLDWPSCGPLGPRCRRNKQPPHGSISKNLLQVTQFFWTSSSHSIFHPFHL